EAGRHELRGQREAGAVWNAADFRKKGRSLQGFPSRLTCPADGYAAAPSRSPDLIEKPISVTPERDVAY
ncbi:hypothetical protein DSI31_08050, partial [Mycobacterium tuberculosis]|uniref:hypothetical protein n=1 Tax=Mycobacterium tuberculosis TaxID=1773 RepID=UPI000E38E08C